MCIRDRGANYVPLVSVMVDPALGDIDVQQGGFGYELQTSCLLYTSDAADERSSVDLGGRRIIKKKKM